MCVLTASIAWATSDLPPSPIIVDINSSGCAGRRLGLRSGRPKARVKLGIVLVPAAIADQAYRQVGSEQRPVRLRQAHLAIASATLVP